MSGGDKKDGDGDKKDGDKKDGDVEEDRDDVGITFSFDDCDFGRSLWEIDPDISNDIEKFK